LFFSITPKDPLIDPILNEVVHTISEKMRDLYMTPYILCLS
jgi:hypothetical protein